MAVIQQIAAERVVGRDVARPDARELEAAQRLAAEEEAVEQADVLAAVAEDVAAARREVEHPVGREGIVVGADQLVADELGVAEPGEILLEPHEVALRRQEAGVAHVVGQVLADQDGQVLALLVLDEARGVVVDVADRVLAHGEAHARGASAR